MNSPGEALLEFIALNKLEVANVGNDPTFVTSVRSEVIDITIVTQRARSWVGNWHVSREVSLSDHKHILFELGTKTLDERIYRNPRTCNWEAFKEDLKQGLEDCPSSPKNSMEVEVMSEFLTQTLTQTFERNCPVKIRKEDRDAIWWNRDLSKKRAEVRRLFNLAKKSGNWEAYKANRRQYGYAVRKAKECSWRKFCEGIESLPECSRLRKILQKDKQGYIGSLKNQQGELTNTEEETLEVLLKSHFPECEIIPDQENRSCEALIPSATKTNWTLANKIVNRTKLVWAINSFQPYKAAGPDGIIPALLQRGREELEGPLCKLFRASIALGYVPQSWRSARVVFIPKPGKASYAETKSFRPISLTSFLLKTLEKLIDRYIRDDVLRENPIHRYQFAYQAGKSCDAAIHRLAQKAEQAMEGKEISLGVFLDIEGAFDSASYNSILGAMHRRGVAHCITQWMEFMLRHRTITSTLFNTTREITVCRGCPQGGVLSPLMWALVVDDLLWELERENLYAQAFADDVSIVVNGKFGAVVFERMQQALNIVERWCIKEGLSTNPAKTSVVAFTRKKNLQKGKGLYMWGQHLKMAKEVKYLGITLDDKLNFCSHIQKTAEKAVRALWACRRTIGSTWGLSPRMMHWLYTRAVVPVVTYSSVIWWHRASSLTAETKLGKVQRLACLIITGAFRTTPTAAMELLLGLPPLRLVVEKEAMAGAYRLFTSGFGWELSKKGYHTMILEKLKQNPVLTMPSDRIPITHDFLKPYDINIPERAKSRETRKTQNESVWYTDGSKMKNSTGAGIYHENSGRTISQNLGSLATVFQAEVIAINTCAQIMLDDSLRNKRVVIMTDSQAALKALQRVEIQSKVVLDCQQSLQALATHNKVTLEWVPGHEGVMGNEKADLLARKGAEKTLTGPEPTCGISYQHVKWLLEERTKRDHERLWMELPGLRQSKIFIEGPSVTRKNQLLNLSRTELRTAVGLFTGHCGLRRHLNLLGLSNDSLCRRCEEEDETPVHILCHCRNLKWERQRHFGEQFPEPEEIAKAPIRYILDYIKNINLMG